MAPVLSKCPVCTFLWSKLEAYFIITRSEGRMALRDFSLGYVFHLLLVSSVLMFFACDREHDEISYDNQFSLNNPETHGDPYKLDYEITDEAISLRWMDITGADSVAVYRKTKQDAEFGFIGWSNSQEYVDRPPVDKTYHYQVRAYRGSLQNDLLFSVGVEAQGDLNDGTISEDLRQKFMEEDISLSDNASVSVETDASWLIASGSKTYIARRQGDELNIYQKGIKAPPSQILEVPYVFTKEVLIPAGEFQMGSDDGEEDEKPEHPVDLNDFYIEAYEVTNALYRRFMAATGYTPPAYWDDPVFNLPEHPVVGVSWSDAKAYCGWVGKRLPTEAEWEKAAHGGPEGKEYTWGDTWPPPPGVGNIPDESARQAYIRFGGDPNKLAIIEDYTDGYPYSAPVGEFSPNGYGLYDMVGNVWEWCADWYESGYYGESPKRNPRGPDSGAERVVRSSSWSDVHAFIKSNLRVANRHKFIPDERGPLTGFRCARSR
jgi:formylglycine-generating enzyme required for sulfatase activity